MAVKSKSDARARRHARLRKKVVGTEQRPRLVVTRSARHVFVQVVDDSKGHTVASASTLEADLRGKFADAPTIGMSFVDVPRSGQALRNQIQGHCQSASRRASPTGSWP